MLHFELKIELRRRKDHHFSCTNLISQLHKSIQNCTLKTVGMKASRKYIG